jgi:hypothetical protein
MELPIRGHYLLVKNRMDSRSFALVMIECCPVTVRPTKSKNVRLGTTKSALQGMKRNGSSNDDH